MGSSYHDNCRVRILSMLLIGCHVTLSYFLFRYGDRVPKSVCGRLFAVVWINAGLVILAMFMGIVTASLTSSSWIDINHFWGIEVNIAILVMLL